MNETANPSRTGRSSGVAEGTSADDVFDALSSARRRNVLAALADRGPLEIGALARAVANAEADEGAVDDRVETVHVSLHHVHLPKLADVGLVTYDHEEGSVVLTTDDLDVPELGVEAGAFGADR